MIPGTWYLVHNIAAALLLLPVSIAAGQRSSSTALLCRLHLSQTLQTKSQQVCPNELFLMIPASDLSHTDHTCLNIALHRLTQLRCLPISWLDHGRRQANKLRTSLIIQNSRLSAPVMPFFNTEPTSQVPSTTQWQSIL